MRGAVAGRSRSSNDLAGEGVIAGSPGPHLKAAPRTVRPFAFTRTTVRRTTIAILAIGLLWRALRFVLAFPLWGDECFLAVNFLTRDLAGLSRPLDFGQIAPPGFLWVEMAIVRLLGDSERALRLVPFLAGIGSLVLFWRFCREVSTTRTTLLAVAILGASLYPARHANEIKPYATDMLVSLGITMLGWNVWREPKRVGRWIALIAFAVVGVWCSYTAVFPIFAVGLLLASRWLKDRSPRFLLGVTLFGVASGASWLAMMLAFARPQMAESTWLATIWADGFPPLSRPWKLPEWFLLVHTGNMMAYPVGGRNFASTATFLLVVTGSVTMAKRPERRPLLLLLLSPLIAAFVASAMGRYPYGVSARVSLFMAPAFCLLAAEGAMAVLRRIGIAHRGSVRLSWILAMVPIVAACVDIAKPYNAPDDREFRAFAKSLAKDSQPGDRWIVFDGADPLPLSFDVMTSKWVQRVAKLRYNLMANAPSRPEWEPDPSSLSPIEGGRTWVILHDHGNEVMYRGDRRKSFERGVRERLGATDFSRVRISTGSKIVVLVAPAKIR